VAREVNQLLGRVFAQRHKDGRTDLEAIESAMRAALHQAGAVALSELLQFAAPGMAADDSMWAEFDRGWNDILKLNEPPAAYLHMRESDKLEGEFSLQ